MKLLSVNIALPQSIEIGGRPVATGIYKRPVTGPQTVGPLGLVGDGQADLSVHGGEYQALYSYSFEHYAFWQESMQLPPLEYGAFGENLTTTGLLETEVCIGDQFRLGTVLLEVTAPRLPCFKFAHKLGRPQILKPFLQSGRSGFYYRVRQPGTFAAGDSIEPVSRSPMGITMRTLLGLMRFGEGDRETLERALAIDCLPPGVREELQQRLG